MIINFKSAMLYLGGRGKYYRSAEINKCNGFTKSILRFKTDKIYHFTFIKELSEGDVYIVITDLSNNNEYIFDTNNQKINFEVRRKRLYMIKIYYKNASGKYKIVWK